MKYIYIVIIFFVSCNLCKIGIKCYNCIRASDNIINSKKDGFLLGNYLPLQKVFINNVWNENVIFDTAWVEQGWFYQSDKCSSNKIKANNNYYFHVNFKKDKIGKFLFNLSLLSNNKEIKSGIGENEITFNVAPLTDTLKVIIQMKNPIDSIGWKQPIQAKDTIIFVKIN